MPTRAKVSQSVHPEMELPARTHAAADRSFALPLFTHHVTTLPLDLRAAKAALVLAMVATPPAKRAAWSLLSPPKLHAGP